MIQRGGLALLSIALVLAACCGSAPVPERRGKTAGIEWAILPIESGADFGYEWEGYWRPDAGTVRSALGGVQAYLVAQFERETAPSGRDADAWQERVWGVREKLPAYKCQVVGIVEDGRRLLYLNFVHSMDLEPHPDDDPADLPDWAQEAHVVNDGGDHYWQAQYDPASGTFVRIDINGEG